MSANDIDTRPGSPTPGDVVGTPVIQESDPLLFRDGADLLADRPVRVYRKSCCGVPREQPCRHDLPARAFEPGCGKTIMCRPASEWGAA